MKQRQCFECKKTIPKHYVIDYCKDCRIELDITLDESQLQEVDICTNCNIEIPKIYIIKYCKPCRKELKLGKWTEESKKTKRWYKQSSEEYDRRKRWLKQRYFIKTWQIKKTLEEE